MSIEGARKFAAVGSAPSLVVSGGRIAENVQSLEPGFLGGADS